jgi:hypothetical protein
MPEAYAQLALANVGNFTHFALGTTALDRIDDFWPRGVAQFYSLRSLATF